jgi:hypothetical protein
MAAMNIAGVLGASAVKRFIISYCCDTVVTQL